MYVLVKLLWGRVCVQSYRDAVHKAILVSRTSGQICQTVLLREIQYRLAKIVYTHSLCIKGPETDVMIEPNKHDFQGVQPV